MCAGNSACIHKVLHIRCVQARVFSLMQPQLKEINKVATEIGCPCDYICYVLSKNFAFFLFYFLRNTLCVTLIVYAGSGAVPNTQ